MIRITHLRSKCIGCYGCVEVAPGRWMISGKDGKSVLIDGRGKKRIYNFVAGDDEYEMNKTAEANCPARVIRVEMV